MSRSIRLRFYKLIHVAGQRELYRDVLEAADRDVILSNVAADDEAARARLLAKL